RSRLSEFLASTAIVQKFCDRCQRAQMRLKLVLWNDEEHDEFHGRIIERVELDTGARSAERGDDVIDAVRRTMRNGDAETDAGAHRLLALFQRTGIAVAIFGFDFAKTH